MYEISRLIWPRIAPIESPTRAESVSSPTVPVTNNAQADILTHSIGNSGRILNPPPRSPYGSGAALSFPGREVLPVASARVFNRTEARRLATGRGHCHQLRSRPADAGRLATSSRALMAAQHLHATRDINGTHR